MVCNIELYSSQPLPYQMELAFAFTKATLLYPFSVKTMLRGLLHTPSLDNCEYTHTHTLTQLLTAAGSLIIAITSVTAVPQLMISVLYGGQLCGELLILRCFFFYGLINKGCSASRYSCFTPMTIHPQCISTQLDMCVWWGGADCKSMWVHIGLCNT